MKYIELTYLHHAVIQALPTNDCLDEVADRNSAKEERRSRRVGKFVQPLKRTKLSRHVHGSPERHQLRVQLLVWCIVTPIVGVDQVEFQRMDGDRFTKVALVYRRVFKTVKTGRP